MALIQCPECGKEVSDKSPNCPNCGCPLAGSDVIKIKFPNPFNKTIFAKCFVYDMNGQILGECKPGETVTFKSNKEIEIKVRFRGSLGGEPKIMACPGKKYKVSQNALGRFSIQEVDFFEQYSRMKSIKPTVSFTTLLLFSTLLFFNSCDFFTNSGNTPMNTTYYEENNYEEENEEYYDEDPKFAVVENLSMLLNESETRSFLSNHKFFSDAGDCISFSNRANEVFFNGQQMSTSTDYILKTTDEAILCLNGPYADLAICVFVTDWHSCIIVEYNDLNNVTYMAY